VTIGKRKQVVGVSAEEKSFLELAENLTVKALRSIAETEVFTALKAAKYPG
jgi:hypothetical protein